MRQGMIHIYCGDGKGKTTAATGLAVRAAGSGMKVLFARFLKNENSAELCVLDQIPGIEVIHLPKSYGFYNTQSEEEKAETKQMYEELWKYALDRAKNGACDMLVMDEFMAADRYGLIPHEEAIQLIIRGLFDPRHLYHCILQLSQRKQWFCDLYPVLSCLFHACFIQRSDLFFQLFQCHFLSLPSFCDCSHLIASRMNLSANTGLDE